MTKEELEKESSNSVSSLQKLSDDLDNEKDTMQKTLSSSQLQDMFKSAGLEENKDEAPTKESDEAKSSEEKVTFVDDEDDEDKEKKSVPPPEDDDVDEREEESDEEEPPMKSEDPYSNDLGATLQGGKPDFGDKFKEFDDLDDDDDERDEQQPDFNEYKSDNQEPETKAEETA